MIPDLKTIQKARLRELAGAYGGPGRGWLAPTVSTAHDRAESTESEGPGDPRARQRSRD